MGLVRIRKEGLPRRSKLARRAFRGGSQFPSNNDGWQRTTSLEKDVRYPGRKDLTGSIAALASIEFCEK
jgi:hypothetical protein